MTVLSPGSREESTAPAATSPSRPGRDKTACDAKGMPQIFQDATVSRLEEGGIESKDACGGDVDLFSMTFRALKFDASLPRNSPTAVGARLRS